MYIYIYVCMYVYIYIYYTLIYHVCGKNIHNFHHNSRKFQLPGEDFMGFHGCHDPLAAWPPTQPWGV